jgi:hypothetical protein
MAGGRAGTGYDRGCEEREKPQQGSDQRDDGQQLRRVNRRATPWMVERADFASELRDPERTCWLRAIASPPVAPILFHGSSEDPSMTQFTARPALFEESIRDQMEALLTELGKDMVAVAS